MIKIPAIKNTATPSFLRAVSAIRDANSPQEALFLYKLSIRRRWHQNQPPHRLSYPFDTHAAVFIFKSISHHLSSSYHLLRHLHAHLHKTNLISNVYVSTTLLNAYVDSSPFFSCSFIDAQNLFAEIPVKNKVTSNTMIKGFLKLGDIRNARRVFKSIPERDRDIASWSVMIGGYIAKGNLDWGLEMFRELVKDCSETCRPDEFLLASLLSGFSVTGSMAVLGKSIHGYCVRNGVELTVLLGTALVDMYAKNGQIATASILFDIMPSKNVVSWTVMISGLAMHGHGQEAMAVFEEMKKTGVTPNEITFTSILNACCHSGMVVEGKKIFRSMSEESGIEPTIHHFGCMVDLFGRAGKLKEAHDVIKNMSIEPNDVVWTSMLAACKEHKEYSFFSDKVMEQVLEMPAGDKSGGLYSLVADMYSMRGNWNKAQQVRDLIHRKSIKKRRGSSLFLLEHMKSQNHLVSDD